jgi:hypothetical protein
MNKLFSLVIALIVVLPLSPPLAIADGILEIRLKDHREAIGDFAKLTLTLDKIAISPKPGLKFWQTGWQNLDPGVAAIDLTQYTGKQSAQIFRGPLPDGSFEGINVKLKQVTGTLKTNQRAAKTKNLVGPVKLPFAIVSGSATLIVLDFVVLDMSDHPPRAYELGIKGWELYTNGKLIDKIPPG